MNRILAFTLLVVMLGYGMVLPVMPFYIEWLGAGGRELGWLMATYSLMQLIFAPIWGVVSDRVGRKPVLMAGVFGYALSLLLFGLSTQFWMLFAARTLSGMLSSATMPTAMAYIGDNSPEGERSRGMGELGAAMGIGVVIGPLLGGLLSENSLSLPFFIGAALAFVAFLLVWFILPESRRKAQGGKDAGGKDAGGKEAGGKEADGKVGGKAGLSWEAVRHSLLSPVGTLLLLVFVMSFGLANFQGITGLYVVDKFAFDTTQVGSVWVVLGGTMILAQGVLVGPLTRRFGEPFLIRLGLGGAALGYVTMTLAFNYVTTLVALGIFTLSLSLTGPALNSYVSALAGERQGTVMGINSASTSLGRVVGPLWAGYLYEINIEYPYLSGAITLVMGLLVSLFAIRRPTAAAPAPTGD